jgi:lipopolysaccharide/colanic/teichoic acid biosynthesis glycosyltransferase
LSANSCITTTYEDEALDRPAKSRAEGRADGVERRQAIRTLAPVVQFSLARFGTRPSPWSQSRAKSFFDCACVLLVMPLLLPLLLVIALAVRLTSHGPALFKQMRVGRQGRAFTILKFRTMIYSTDKTHHAVSTATNQQFTLIGPLLRRWKLDELPQLLNVLWGDMSLVGPRPKMPEHVIVDLPCRPGITGAATIVFACEEAILDLIPKHQLDNCYHTIILPAKRQLDSEYMARATFFSDLKLIVNSVLRRWHTSAVNRLLNIEAFEETDRADRTMLSISSDPEVA